MSAGRLTETLQDPMQLIEIIGVETVGAHHDRVIDGHRIGPGADKTESPQDAKHMRVDNEGPFAQRAENCNIAKAKFVATNGGWRERPSSKSRNGNVSLKLSPKKPSD